MKNIKDLEFKIISFLATGYSTYVLGGLFNQGDYGVVNSVIWGLSGVLISILYAKKVTAPLVDANAKKGVMLASLPFVLSWILITIPVYNKYVDVFVQNGYIELRAEQRDLRMAKRDSRKMNLSIKERVTSSQIVDRKPLQKLINNKDKIIQNFITVVQNDRAIWKESTRKVETKYEVYKSDFKKKYQHDYGNGSVAINNFATMLYENQVFSLRDKFNRIDASARNYKGMQTDKVKLEKLKTNAIRYKVVVNKIKKIENKDALKLSGMYGVMVLWGIFFELFLTHVSLWLNPVLKRQQKRDIMLNDLANNPKLFLSIFNTEANHRINAVFSVLRCYAHGDKLTEKNINKWSYFVNPTTNKKYKPNRLGMTAKNILKEYGFFAIENPNINQEQLLDVIENMVR